MTWERDVNKIMEITSAEFEERVLRSPIPALVKFHADWCGPCRLLAPILEEVAEELQGQVAVFKVDATENIDLVRRLGHQRIADCQHLRERARDRPPGRPSEQGTVDGANSADSEP